MIVIVDVILGLLLAVSALLLVICLVAYRRSGVKSIALSCYVLAPSLAYDVAILAAGHWTNWFVDIHEAVFVAVGAVLLAVGVIIARIGGRFTEGSS